ncbi:MAG: ATP-grasp domain-containing protein [Bacteroidetes bacterium]|nr:ATP-grasp domain-containing protein [bacterium]NBP65311.1 ATP-grasp domain-containing protein [Bacteroidota bacterium]
MQEIYTVVLIGAGLFQLPAIKEAKRLGLYVIALDGDANAPGLPYADKYFIADIKDPKQCIEIIRPFRPAAVFALATEVAVRTVADICAELDLKGVSPEAAINSTNKKRMRDCFLRDKLPSPKFIAVNDTVDLDKNASNIGYPLVTKPADSAGSRGVTIVETQDQLAEAFAHAKKYSTSGEVLLEEYMSGDEISVEAFIQNGNIQILSLSDKIRTPKPFPLDTRVIFPSNKDDKIQIEARRIAEQAIVSCGIDNAVIHIEMMVTPTGPKLVEIAARGAGFHVFSNLLSWVCDINTVELLINISLGREVKLTKIKQRGAVLSFPSAKRGIVKKIENIETIKKTEGIYDAELYIKVGDQINPLKSGSDRIGHIIAFGSDRNSALEIAENAESLLKIEVL